jgi:hypothetical protein
MQAETLVDTLAILMVCYLYRFPNARKDIWAASGSPAKENPNFQKGAFLLRVQCCRSAQKIACYLQTSALHLNL